MPRYKRVVDAALIPQQFIALLFEDNKSTAFAMSSTAIQSTASVYTLPKAHAKVIQNVQERFPGQDFDDVLNKKGSHGDLNELLTNSFKLETSQSFFQYSFKAEEAFRGIVPHADILEACKKAVQQLDSRSKESIVFDVSGIFICSQRLPEAFIPKVQFTDVDGSPRECNVVVSEKQLKVEDMAK